MKLSLNRSAALGAATALFLGTLAAVPVGSPAAAAGPTTLTKAQAQAVLLSTLRATESRGLRQGMRLSQDYAGWSIVLTVDPERRRTSLRYDATGEVPPYKSIPPNPCIANGTPSRHSLDVMQAGVRWERLGLVKAGYEKRALTLLKRSDDRWVKRKASNASPAGVVRDAGIREWFSTDSDVYYLSTGGSVTTTASGRHYVLTSREGGPASEAAYGSLTFDVAPDGSLVSARNVFVDVETDVSPTRYVDELRVSYGAQYVAKPKTGRTIAAKTLRPACRAIMTKDYPRDLAHVVASWVNERRGPATVRQIRSEAREDDWSDYYRLDVTITNIRYGVQITARHRLLEHPRVTTVFVRNGKAVIHRVR